MVTLLGPAASPAQEVPDVMVLLDRAGQYATDYGAAFRPVIAQEYYEQTEWIRGAPRSWRKLHSDFIMVHVPEDDHWLGFRDVRAVDGQELGERDRSRRLERLLSGDREKRRLRDEAARYNVGEIERNVNVPTLALRYLETGALHRSNWEVGDMEEVDGIRVVPLSFEEIAHPTFVQSLSLKPDVPARGTFWVDPADGTVIRSQLRLEESGGAEGTITVTYRFDPDLSIWLPGEMDEVYTPDLGRRPFDETKCRAVYSDYVSAEVRTEELGVRLKPEQEVPD
jgi:hypothetical protein